MGVLWTTYPLDDEMKGWLDSQDVWYPDSPSRFPTGNEIKEALAGLPGVDVQITDNGVGASWQAWIISDTSPEEMWTLLNISRYSGDDEPQELWFEKGHEQLIKTVLNEICKTSGPIVLMPDTGDPPEVVGIQHSRDL